MDNELSQLSLYYLMVELLCDGESGIHPHLEPIDVGAIYRELESRSGRAFGPDRERWVRWFLAQGDETTELERINILKTARAMKLFG